jgi:hypothetical protein
MGTQVQQGLRVVAPLAVALVVVVGVQVWWAQGYSPSGHAAEHFGSASVVFGMAFVLMAIGWALPATERRRPMLWALLGLVALAALVNARANLMVVDAIGDEDWSIDVVNALGPTREGFEEGHELGERAALAGVAAAGALVVWLRFRRVISTRLCVGALVACVVFPFWVFPGFGLVVVAGVLVTRRVRRELDTSIADLQPTAT